MRRARRPPPAGCACFSFVDSRLCAGPGVACRSARIPARRPTVCLSFVCSRLCRGPGATFLSPRISARRPTGCPPACILETTRYTVGASSAPSPQPPRAAAEGGEGAEEGAIGAGAVLAAEILRRCARDDAILARAARPRPRAVPR
eukprot:tig00000448_g869.t1